MVTENSPILVVDDNEENREVLTRLLARRGYLTAIATDGVEALEMLKTNSYQMMLLDINMPNMDGFAVLEALKNSPLKKQLPIIMITANDDLKSMARCIELGAEDYITKPLQSANLHSRIEACRQRWGFRHGKE